MPIGRACRFLGRRDDGVINALWGRRPSKARNRGRWAAAVQRTLWGFGRGVRLEGIGAQRSPRSLLARERRCVQE
jgi:hypothetical protein